MKARLIVENKKLRILCEDGTIVECTDSLLYSFLMDFQQGTTFSGEITGRWDSVYPDMSMYPGETVAFILKQKQLVINDISPFKMFLANETAYRNFLSTTEYAKKHSVSNEIVKVHCRQGRIEGARKIGKTWAIPENAEYPADKRHKNN